MILKISALTQLGPDFLKHFKTGEIIFSHRHNSRLMLETLILV